MQNAEGMSICPLHVRSGYSLLAGTALPDRLLDRAGELGHARLALTDVNNLCGATLFCRLAGEKGIAPIVGAELTDGSDAAVALVAEESGYRNLCRLITRRHAEGTDPGTRGTESRARNTARPARSAALCGIRDFPELSAGLHFVVEDAALAERLLEAGVRAGQVWLGLDPATQSPAHICRLNECADRLGLPLTATGRSLFLEEQDYPVARLLAAIRLGTTYDALRPDQLPHPRAALRSRGQLAGELAAFPRAVSNNHRLAERCAAFRLLPRKPVFPGFACPDGLSGRAYLRRLCQEGMRRRYPQGAPPGGAARLEKELRVIELLGFSEYFLVVWDIVQYARRRGAPVAGRGSGASSLVAYVLGLTNVCPLTYEIPFERFLHEGREDFPDLDIDFCWRIRDEVIEYAFNRWGKDHVAMVSMHTTFQPRSAIRETAKALGLSDAQVSRMVDEGALAEPPAAPEDPLARVHRLAAGLSGLVRNLSVHPGGIVIGRLPIDHYVPVQPAPKGVTITQYDKNGVEDIRLVKLDLLGNRNLSTIRHAFDLVRRRAGRTLQAESLPTGDAETVALLRSAETVGCNQLESPAMRHLLRMLRPAGPRDVMQALALIRPGAASIGMKEVFVRRRLGLEPAPKGDARVDAILGATCGVMLYEDDVMLVAAALTGSSLREADRFRKAVQKCPDDRRRLELSREFLARCRDNGADAEYAKELWVQMAKFNAYSFCRAHAASYALLAYAGAYLKAHYPLEFWVASLNNNQSMYHPRVYVAEARRRGVHFLPPDANSSRAEFALEGDAVRVGLDRIAGLGPAGIAAILDSRRRDGPFAGLSDFLRRTGLARQEARAMVLCGAFDFTGRKRPALMLELELASAARLPAGRRQGTLLPPTPVVPDAPGDYPDSRKWRDQREILGINLGPHVLADYRAALAHQVDADSRQIQGRLRRRIRIAGMLEAIRATPSRNGRPITFLTLEDEYGLFEVSAAEGACRMVRFSSYGPYVVAGRVEDQYGAITISADRVSGK